MINKAMTMILCLSVSTLCYAVEYKIPNLGKLPKCQFIQLNLDGSLKLKMEGKTQKVNLIGVILLYDQAETFVTNLLVGEDLCYQVLKTKDEVGVYLYRLPDGLFVNLEIIRQGYGKADKKRLFKRLKLFMEFEKKAEIHKKGFWSLSYTDDMIDTVSEEKPSKTGEYEILDSESYGMATHLGQKYWVRISPATNLAQDIEVLSMKIIAEIKNQPTIWSDGRRLRSPDEITLFYYITEQYVKPGSASRLPDHSFTWDRATGRLTKDF